MARYSIKAISIVDLLLSWICCISLICAAGCGGSNSGDGASYGKVRLEITYKASHETFDISTNDHFDWNWLEKRLTEDKFSDGDQIYVTLKYTNLTISQASTTEIAKQVIYSVDYDNSANQLVIYRELVGTNVNDDVGWYFDDERGVNRIMGEIRNDFDDLIPRIQQGIDFN